LDLNKLKVRSKSE